MVLYQNRFHFHLMLSIADHSAGDIISVTGGGTELLAVEVTWATGPGRGLLFRLILEQRVALICGFFCFLFLMEP